jgi:glycerol kinase
MPEFVGAIDQGTTSTRFMVFDHGGCEVARHQVEHTQLLPQAGWVEHDPVEIVDRARQTMAVALANAGLAASDLVAVGMANQRETTVIWDPHTGRPYLNAIVWQDTRTAAIVSHLSRSPSADLIRGKTGLPVATYFSAPKVQWALAQVDGLAAAARQGRALFGTIDTWLLWNLTGGHHGGRHLTDVTNASRTMLMDLRSLSWDPVLLDIFEVPEQMLPQICPSGGDFGSIDTGAAHGARSKVPVTAVVGDQQAAMVGQVCFGPGEAKNTYGTGNFVLSNTGRDIPRSGHGLLSTVCCQFRGDKPTYALEGPVAVTGSAVQWLRDQLGLIKDAAETEELASEVPDNGGVYFVPAFSGLFAPYWRPDARGAIVGLTRAATKAHLARATLESICYQTKDVLVAMAEDTGTTLDCLKVDGGVTANNLCMQLQADILGIPVSKPAVAETTALGAAYTAGCALGWWAGGEELRQIWREGRRWEPQWDEDQRQTGYSLWQKAVDRTLGWA